MQFFTTETTLALSTFVRQFEHGASYEKNILSLIREFAGGDEVGLILRNIVAKCELEFGQDIFNHGPYSTIVSEGRIHGRWVQVIIKAVNGGLPTDTVYVKTNNAARHQDYGRLLVTKTTVANFTPLFLRNSLWKIMSIHWENLHCRYCDCLVTDENSCKDCRLTINAEEKKCHFCQSACGGIECGKLKRGRNEPKVYYHVACKKRKMFHF